MKVKCLGLLPSCVFEKSDVLTERLLTSIQSQQWREFPEILWLPGSNHLWRPETWNQKLWSRVLILLDNWRIYFIENYQRTWVASRKYLCFNIGLSDRTGNSDQINYNYGSSSNGNHLSTFWWKLTLCCNLVITNVLSVFHLNLLRCSGGICFTFIWLITRLHRNSKSQGFEILSSPLTLPTFRIFQDDVCVVSLCQNVNQPRIFVEQLRRTWWKRIPRVCRWKWRVKMWIINMVMEVAGAFVGPDYTLCMYKVNGLQLMNDF